MPKIQIVNDKDEIIGYKNRNEVEYNKDIFRTAALWITNSRGQILIAQRKFTKDKDPGKWGPAVAGTVEENESYESNIYKEAEGEIGLTGCKFQIGPKHLSKFKRAQFVQWFALEIDKPASYFRLQEDEVEKVEWISLEVLKFEIKNNPNKYIPLMPGIIKLFS